MITTGNGMSVSEEVATEWQRRLTVITAALLASESAGERWNLLLFTDSSLRQPQADRAQESVQTDEEALLLCHLVIDQSTGKEKNKTGIRE